MENKNPQQRIRLRDGGPAFPRAATLDPMGGTVNMAQGGMSVRAYYAAHAPEMPDWFKYENPEPRPIPLRADKELSPKHYEQWQGLGDYLDDHQVEPEVLAYRDRNRAAQNEHNSWTMRDKMSKVTAWRHFYADSMLAAGTGAALTVDGAAHENLMVLLTAELCRLREKILHDQGVSVVDIDGMLAMVDKA